MLEPSFGPSRPSRSGLFRSRKNSWIFKYKTSLNSARTNHSRTSSIRDGNRSGFLVYGRLDRGGYWKSFLKNVFVLFFAIRVAENSRRVRISRADVVQLHELKHIAGGGLYCLDGHVAAGIDGSLVICGSDCGFYGCFGLERHGAYKLFCYTESQGHAPAVEPSLAPCLTAC